MYLYVQSHKDKDRCAKSPTGCYRFKDKDKDIRSHLLLATGSTFVADLLQEEPIQIHTLALEDNFEVVIPRTECRFSKVDELKVIVGIRKTDAVQSR